MIQLECGEEAVRSARAAAVSETEGKPYANLSGGIFGEPRGVFVTYSMYPSHDLRGCIGYPMPVLPLGEAIEASARAACHDPRFPDLRRKELDSLTVEVTVLTVPEIMDVPKDRLPKAVEIGRHGLIITCAGRRGLLLPQVPVEWGWDAIEYLENLSMKAGLPPDSWKRQDAVIESFEGEIFHEVSPEGKIERG